MNKILLGSSVLEKMVNVVTTLVMIAIGAGVLYLGIRGVRSNENLSTVFSVGSLAVMLVGGLTLAIPLLAWVFVSASSS